MKTFDHWIPTGAGKVLVREWQPVGSVAAAPIVLLHDSLGCIELWRDFPSNLCEHTGRRILAYDRPGFGRSDMVAEKLPLDFITQEWASSLRPVIDTLQLPRFVLLGHSVGGGMAVVGAANLGMRCTALITESAQVFGEEITFDGIRAASTVFVPGSPSYDRLKSYHGSKTDWVLRSWIENWLDPKFVLALQPEIRRVACPVLALHGTRDEYGSVAQARLIHGQAISAHLKLFADCGHVPHRERPKEVLTAIADFLSDLRD